MGTSVSIPPQVRLALLVLLNHVEPGWENCVSVVKAWLEGETDEPSGTYTTT